MIKPTIHEYNGVKGTKHFWAERLGIPVNTFQSRLRKLKLGKMTKDRVFNPIDTHIRHNGISRTAKEWAKALGITEAAFDGRRSALTKGEITEAQCFTAGNRERKDAVKVKIRGRVYTTEGLANKLGISKRLARGRMKRFLKGLIPESSLMAHGKIPRENHNYEHLLKYRLKDGRKVSPSTIANLVGLFPWKVRKMIRSGMSPDDIMEWASKDERYIRGKYWIEGVPYSTSDLRREKGLTSHAIRRRLVRGWTMKDAVSELPVSAEETKIRARSKLMSINHKRQLAKMGILV